MKRSIEAGSSSRPTSTRKTRCALLTQLDAIVEDLRSGAEVAALGLGIPSRIDQRRGRAGARTLQPRLGR
jgi:predicted NBD/HSP70 family sugar kinase